MVKNRCENGDYYWVKATVTPVYEGSNLLGYRSVRKQPTRDEVMAAERLYQRIKNGEKITLDTLAERRQAAGMLGRFSLMLRWWMPQVLSALGLASVAFMAVSEVNQDILIASTGVAIVVPLLLTAWAGAQTTKVLQKIQQGMQRFDLFGQSLIRCNERWQFQTKKWNRLGCRAEHQPACNRHDGHE
jgi:aerotaxis receptor